MFFLLLLLCVYVCREWERGKKKLQELAKLERLERATSRCVGFSFLFAFSSIPFLHREPHAVPLQRFSVFNWCVY